MRGWRGALVIASVFALSLVAAPGAGATGYGVTGAFFANGLGTGIAVDQSNGTVYLANSYSPTFFSPWEITAFDSEGVSPTTFVGDVSTFGVAVNQADNSVVALRLNSDTGTQEVATYDSDGELLGLPYSPFPEFNPNVGLQIAVDSNGNVYVPGADKANEVRKFSSAGVEAEGAFPLDCSACAGPSEFATPTDVVLDSSGNIYVADSGNERVVKFDAAGENPTVFRAGASNFLAINAATGQVFVLGDDGNGYHVSAYDSTGNEIADFGDGELTGVIGPLDLAVNEATDVVYVRNVLEEGFVSLVWMFAPAEPPVATTATASSIASTTVTLNGTVNPEGAEVSDCHFEYGPTDAYGSEAPCVPDSLWEGEDPVSVSANLSGLSAKTSYHFKLVAEGVGGTGEGEDETFTTLPTKPAISAESVGGISQHVATLSGKVNPNGAATTCEFEYGTTIAYGTKVPCTTNPGSGEAAVEVTIPALSGLASGTTYHYRINATNAGGTANGADKTFATLADTCATNAALCPPPPPAITPPAKKPLKCKKGLKKKTIQGKQKCVKVKKKQKRR